LQDLTKQLLKASPGFQIAFGAWRPIIFVSKTQGTIG